MSGDTINPKQNTNNINKQEQDTETAQAVAPDKKTKSTPTHDAKANIAP